MLWSNGDFLSWCWKCCNNRLAKIYQWPVSRGLIFNSAIGFVWLHMNTKSYKWGGGITYMLHFWHLIHMNVLDLEFNSSDSHRFLQFDNWMGTYRYRDCWLQSRKLRTTKWQSLKMFPIIPPVLVPGETQIQHLNFRKTQHLSNPKAPTSSRQ